MTASQSVFGSQLPFSFQELYRYKSLFAQIISVTSLNNGGANKVLTTYLLRGGFEFRLVRLDN
jgi:predicted AAA+ superfamily ATPase